MLVNTGQELRYSDENGRKLLKKYSLCVDLYERRRNALHTLAEVALLKLKGKCTTFTCGKQTIYTIIVTIETLSNRLYLLMFQSYL